MLNSWWNRQNLYLPSILNTGTVIYWIFLFLWKSHSDAVLCGKKGDHSGIGNCFEIMNVSYSAWVKSMKVTLFNIIGRRLLKMDWYFPCNYGAHDREMILIDSSWRQGNTNDCDIVTECLIRIILDRWKWFLQTCQMQQDTGTSWGTHSWKHWVNQMQGIRSKWGIDQIFKSRQALCPANRCMKGTMWNQYIC